MRAAWPVVFASHRWTRLSQGWASYIQRLDASSVARSRPAPVPRQPWASLAAGSRQTGIIVALGRYGTLVELDAGYTGLLPQWESFKDDANNGSALWPRIGDRVSAYVAKKKTVAGQKRVTLSADPPSVPIKPIRAIIADGCEPHEAVVDGVGAMGIFLDIGAEFNALLPNAWFTKYEGEEGQEEYYQLGRKLTVYAIEVDVLRSRIFVSLEKSQTPLRLRRDFQADGQTPYEGIIRHFSKGRRSAEVDIGGSIIAKLFEMDPEHKVGDKITVYMFKKTRKTGQMKVCLTPTEKPVLRVQDLKADGVTVYEGVFASAPHTPSAVEKMAHYLVDFGCEEDALLARTDPYVKQHAISLGDPIQFYIRSKFPFIAISTVPLMGGPMIPTSAMKADGVTLYKGIVESAHAAGVFIDMNCELRGYLTSPDYHPQEQSVAQPLLAGDEVSVYPWFKMQSKMLVSLTPREKPAIPIEDMSADAVTPVTATVWWKSHRGVWADVGTDILGVLRPNELSTDAEKAIYDGIEPGDQITVYLARRNVTVRRLILSLVPARQANMLASRVQKDEVYTGIVEEVRLGMAFVSFGCEVVGMLSLMPPKEVLGQSATPSERMVKCGDEVTVRVLGVDAQSGRFRLQQHQETRPMPPQRKGAPSIAAGP